MCFIHQFLETLKTITVGLAATLLAQFPASAATLSICPVGCDASTFQGAINMASAGDTITLLATFPHTEADIVVTESLTLQGIQNLGGLLQADSNPGTSLTRVLTVLTGVTVVVRDLTIRHGVASDGGAILNQLATEVFPIARPQ